MFITKNKHIIDPVIPIKTKYQHIYSGTSMFTEVLFVEAKTGNKLISMNGGIAKIIKTYLYCRALRNH